MKWMSENLGLVARALGFLVVVILLAVVAGRYYLPEDLSPCADNGKPRRCYHVNREVCQIAWDKAEETCTAFVKGFKLPPGRLLGAAIHECQLATFDESFALVRKADEDCEKMYLELKDWRRSNMN
jgi:hypothetical protein